MVLSWLRVNVQRNLSPAFDNSTVVGLDFSLERPHDLGPLSSELSHQAYRELRRRNNLLTSEGMKRHKYADKGMDVNTIKGTSSLGMGRKDTAAWKENYSNGQVSRFSPSLHLARNREAIVSEKLLVSRLGPRSRAMICSGSSTAAQLAGIKGT